MGILRAILALMVVFRHLNFLYFDPRLAVQMFFLISGFYMAMVWNDRYRAYSNPIRTFYISRALRIYPLYLIVLSTSIAVACYALTHHQRSVLTLEMYFPLSVLSRIFVYLSQITIFGMETHTFLERLSDGSIATTSTFLNHQQPWIIDYQFVPQAWSLAIELAFYLVVPFLLSKWRLALGVLVISLLLRTLFWFRGAIYDPWTYRFFPLEIALFLAGSLSHIVWQRCKETALNVLSTPVVRVVVGGTPILMVASFNVIEAQLGEFAYWICYFFACLTVPVLFELSKMSKVDSWIGELSFPIYISHMLVINVLLIIGTTNYIPSVVASTILLSILLSRIQNKVDLYRYKIARNESGSELSRGV